MATRHAPSLTSRQIDKMADDGLDEDNTLISSASEQTNHAEHYTLTYII